MKKAVSLLLIVCLAITLLAGCSGNASQPSSEPPAAQETAAPQTDASQGESEPAAKKKKKAAPNPLEGVLFSSFIVQ